VSKKKRMTERQWLACGASGVVAFERTTQPHPMLVHLLGRASHRKLRLFACAYRRRIECLMAGMGLPGRTRRAVRRGRGHAGELADERLDSAPDENYKDGAVLVQ
jgi:hypothetical protein